MKTPVRITVTGAAGQIGYSLLFRILSGDLLGPDQPVRLQLLERDAPESRARMKGVLMELDDCAFPLLADVITSTDPRVAFEGAQIAFLLGSSPRKKGMQRADLLAANGPIFVEQGRALDDVAARDVRVLVVGNPCNTNAWIAAQAAPGLSPRCFHALMRLDHNRALSQLSHRTGAPVTAIEKMAVWGNHADTMLPDLSWCTVEGKPALSVVEKSWWLEEMVPTVARRGSAIIAARGASSAASAASAAVDHMRDWCLGSQGRWVSMAVPSDGRLGIPEGMVFGMPCVCEGGDWKPVEVEPGEITRGAIERNVAALRQEIEAVRPLLG